MDPLTAIGAVASVCQLAQAALSLSKSLYALGSAIASASEDVQILADDLGTFSQSLALLSRLLEDSKCWYSDDIYLLTAKIIKDCVELYAKIDRILVKLGSNGKSNWKLRVKFVYKESQIRKLVSRLRDMKGTLATILISLQVDLQLSLLNISSSSRIHRTHEKALQPETIHRLRLAQKAIEDGNVCEKQSDSSLEFPRNATQVRNFTKSPVSPSNTQSHGHISTSPVSQTNVDMMQSFVVISSEQQRTSEVLRSSCSAESLAESFKSALSVQTSELDLARKIKSVQGTIHAFKTAIETLDNLIQRRLLDKSEEIYVAAVKLRVMLGEASQKVDCKNTENYKHHGDGYIRGFHDVYNSTLQRVTSSIMQSIVMKLHEYSADYEELAAPYFDALCDLSTQYSREICNCLDCIALVPPRRPSHSVVPQVNCSLHSQGGPIKPEASKYSHTLANYTDNLKLRTPASTTLPFIGYTFKRFDNFTNSHANHDSFPNDPSRQSALAKHSSHTTCDVIDSSSISNKAGDLASGEGNDTRAKSYPLNSSVGPDSLTVLFGGSGDQLDVLQDFDFDSFLHEDDSNGIWFRSGETSSTAEQIPQTDSLFLADHATELTPEYIGMVKDSNAVSESIHPETPLSQLKYQHNEQSNFSPLDDISVPRSWCGSPNLSNSNAENRSNTRSKPSHKSHGHKRGRDELESDDASNPLKTKTKIEVDDILPLEKNTADGYEEREVRQSKLLEDYHTLLPVEDKCRHRNSKLTRYGRDKVDADSSTAIGSLPSNRYEGHPLDLDQFHRIQAGRASKNDLEARLTTAMANQSQEGGLDDAQETVNFMENSPSPTAYLVSSLVDSQSIVEELSWTNPALTVSQTCKVWWQAYISLVAFSSSPSDTFNTLNPELQIELGISPTLQFSDAALAQKVSSNFNQLPILKLDETIVPEMQAVFDIRDNILRIVRTIDEQLGLEIATLGWAFVWVFFAIYEPLLLAPTKSLENIVVMKRIFVNLETVVSMIARYAVMENLYQQSHGALSLKPEYRILIISLCSAILEYFATTFVLGRCLARLNENGASLDDQIQGCDQLMKHIRAKDIDCQAFRVIVDVCDCIDNGGSETDSLCGDESEEEISDNQVQVG